MFGFFFGAISSYLFQSFAFLKEKSKRISTAIWAKKGIKEKPILLLQIP
jgi:hypothetical protein